VEWHGQGVDETGRDSRTGKILVAVDPVYFRPTEVDSLVGDAQKAKTILGWEPQYDLSSLIEEMVAADIKKYLQLLHGGDTVSINQID
jgi:GDPmannose 4,6-dehydratase